MHERNFTLAFETDIPRLVGLSGSSAIVVATMRALMKFYDLDVPLHLQPALVLSAERDELGIAAGLQDRVIQSYEGMVYMDFDRSLVEGRGYGQYVPLRPAKMPPLYLAFDPERAEISDVTHRNLRDLYNRGDPAVVEAMTRYRGLTDRGRAAIEVRRLGITGSGDERKLRPAADDHADRAGEFADDRSGPVDRRVGQIRRQRRRDRRALQGRQSLPAVDRRPGRDPMHAAAASGV